MRRDLPTGTVTFLFTDIEGSTRLLHALGPDAYAEALAEHRRVLRAILRRTGGVEVDTQGDAFFVAFPTAAEERPTAALEAQQELASGPISVRMGLHTGTPTAHRRRGTSASTSIAARALAALAHGGQIVLLTRNRSASRRSRAARPRAPPAQGLRQRRSGSRSSTPPSSRRCAPAGASSCPSPATRFLGRERELFDAISLVYDHDPRVLSILGAGGTGKTRFAIELGRLLADEAEGGTVFCALAPTSRAGVRAVDDRRTTWRTVGRCRRQSPLASERRRTHVVVDNIEHLLPDAARRLGRAGAGDPRHAAVRHQSRGAPQSPGEHELDLPPLVDDDAVALFLERAHAVGADIEATETVQRTLRAPRSICRSRSSSLPCARSFSRPMRSRAGSATSLDLLKGTRDADERHATLRATIAWSYDLLYGG